MIELCPLMSRLKSGIWPILGLKLAILSHIFQDIDFKFVLPCIYNKSEGKTKLEVNRTQNYQFSFKKAT